MRTLTRLSAPLLILISSLYMGCMLEPQDEGQRLVDHLDQPLPEGYKRVVYLNRHGGEFVKGTRNSAQDNTSTVLDVDGPVSIPPFEGDDAQWNSVVACVREQFAAYELRIEPSLEPDGPHMEIVVGGTYQDALLKQRVEGLAPQRLDCEILERGVGFVFSQQFFGDVEKICWATSHELGHLLGLDHSLDCDENMSYTPACGQKVFKNEDLLCGEDFPRECICGGETQNSDQHLLSKLGPAATLKL